MHNLLANIRQKAENVNPFGGIIFCMGELSKIGMPELIDKHFGKRVKQAKYKYSDVLLSWIYSTMCGSERLEDTKQLKTHFKEIPDSKLPSPDRIAGIFKKMATPTLTYISKESNHEFNINIPLNSLLMDIALKLNSIPNKNSHVMDYDNVVIPCEKYDSKYSYKKFEGYSPGVAFIGKCPIYIEGINGNTPAKYKMEETIQRAFNLAKEKNIKIKIFRSDAAAYSQKVIKTLVKNNMEFFIRANHSEQLFSIANENDEWKSVTIADRIWEITSINYDYLDGKTYRVVITRDFKGDDFANKHTKDNYVYRAIITNNTKLSNKEVVHFYNQRGKIENNFTQLLNDWNWKRLPFSFLNQNVVFMILSAIGCLMYNYIIEKFSKKVNFLKSNFRLKNFIFHFITVALVWTIEDKEKVPILNMIGRDYSPLFGKRPRKN